MTPKPVRFNAYVRDLMKNRDLFTTVKLFSQSGAAKLEPLS